MKKFLAVFTGMLLSLMLMTSVSFAGEYIYPDEKNPEFSITFPDDWKVETEEDVLHAGPKDDSIYMGIWAVGEEATDDNIKAVLDGVDELVAELLTDVKPIGEAQKQTINEIPFVIVDGTGKLKDDGSAVNVSIALFVSDGKNLFTLVYFGIPDAEKAHEKELVDILNSVKGKK